jgi:uncharacterized protein
VIAYLDSSVLARVYLSDEVGHEDAVALLENPDVVLVTGTWSRVEVSGALVRAARVGRGDERGLLALLDADLGQDGPVTVVSAPQVDVETMALTLVRRHGLRAMDAWHVAMASLTLTGLAEPEEARGFASRDQAQSEVATHLGLQVI